MINTSRDIAERFVESFNELRYRKLVKTKLEFCKVVGLASQSNLNRMIAPERPSEPSLTNILLLHEKFGVSISWIMLGEGSFFSNAEK